MNITIEQATPADAAAMLAYLRQVGGETNNLTFGAEGLPVSVEEEAAHIARLQNSPDGILLVAKAQGRIIGDASLARLPRRMRHRGDFGIAVIREYWNRGVGGKLLDGIIRFAREHDFDCIDLQVRCDNPGAIHLYEKFGFQKLCTYPGFFKLGEERVDFDFMCLHLR